MEYIMRCDRCNCVMEIDWTRVLLMSGQQVDLCKSCTKKFNAWLKESK